MPVRSHLRSYGPDRYIAVKHYWSVVYMNCVLHSTQHRTQRNQVDVQYEDHVDPSDQSRRVERGEDTGAHETRAIPPTRQIPTTPAYPTRGTGADGGGAIS